MHSGEVCTVGGPAAMDDPRPLWVVVGVVIVVVVLVMVR